MSEFIFRSHLYKWPILKIGKGVKYILPPLYVTPRLIHGLEACVLPSGSLRAIDQYYKNLLRQIQGLPENTATEAVFLL